MRQSVLFCASVFALALPSVSIAGVFKCLDTDGSVTYSQTACEPEQKTSKILEISSESGPKQDCRASSRFARSVAESMKAGESSGDLFTRYGGIDSLNPSSISLINYVYSHRDNDAASISRITALTTTRCEVGSFGISDCDTLPYEFIESVGGCEAAKTGSNGPVNANAANFNSTNQPVSQRSNQRTSQQNSEDITDGQSELASEDCRTRLTADIKEVYIAMRGARSAAEQSELNDRRNELRRQLGYCK